MKKLLLLACLISLPAILRAQAPCKFHVSLDYHYNLGLSECHMGSAITRSDGYNMHGNSLHITALYDVSNRISAGAGFGLDRYEEPGYNTLPIFGAFRYRPIRKYPDPYLYTNLGYGIGNERDLYAGWMWDAGIGYTKMFYRHFGLNFQFGYNLKTFHMHSGCTVHSNLRHSLSFGVGLVF